MRRGVEADIGFGLQHRLQVEVRLIELSLSGTDGGVLVRRNVRIAVEIGEDALDVLLNACGVALGDVHLVARLVVFGFRDGFGGKKLLAACELALGKADIT